MAALDKPPGTWHRVGVIVLVLIVGLLSSGIDELAGHQPPATTSVNSHTEGDRLPVCHLVRDYLSRRGPPCNACFFYKLLGQSVIPSSTAIAFCESYTRHAESALISLSRVCFNPLVGRGPPAA